jgi:hypothetical protein
VTAQQVPVTPTAPVRQRSLYLTDDAMIRLKTQAVRERRTVSAIVAEAIDEYLARHSA